MQEISTKRI